MISLIKNDQQKNMQIIIQLFKLLRYRYVLFVHHCQFITVLAGIGTQTNNLSICFFHQLHF